MRTRLLAGLVVLVSASCAGPNPYGPSSDERLDMATSGISPSPDVAKANAKHLEAIQAQSCDGADAKIAALGKKPESDRLAGYVGILKDLRAKKTKMDSVLDKHPGLQFFKGKAADGVTYDIQTTVKSCTSSLSDVGTKLDSLIRDIARVPIVDQIVGRGRHRHTVPTARVDFDLLVTAIKALGPVDADVLVAHINEAKKRLDGGKHRSRRRRHRR